MDHAEDATPADEAPEDTSLANPDVTTKYRTVGDIVNAALESVVSKCVEGADVLELCRLGDSFIEDKTAGLYNAKKGGKKKVEKGLAFPTCISVNEVSGHFSPLPGDSYTLQKGDLAKVDMGGHIDGYICVAAHTVVVGPAEGDESNGEGSAVTGRKADVLRAAWTAAEAALRKVKVGNKNTDVTAVINKAASEFQCSPMQGNLSHQMKRHVIDGNQVIIAKELPEEKVDEFEFGMNEVYGIDIVMSTGEGKPKESEHKTTIYKRAVETNYGLKTQLARSFLAEVNRRFPTLPFNIRSVEDERAMRVGVSECMRHELLHPYPVLCEKQGEYVAQFKFTLLLLPGGTKKITGLALGQDSQIQSEFTVQDEDLKKILATSANPKKAKKKGRSEQEATNGKAEQEQEA
ncbi:unnamed protein product [Vitrella brassicaformis CCMP3155]|uniref:Peptidase M24 domain-containing protein n=2 Tax=Vitrella brassicaformis TaxID=1169539 RepID=A0A0G4ENH4_VITBC|nr:unnamed protein product [Vitrella brassicaformis CCMP3155]|eukprot:CEL99403.1 unnamed protein product [Vitrella brassicaformis CCMP3155]